MTKKLTYQGLFKSHLLADELLAAFPSWGGVTYEGTTRMQSKPDGTEVYLFVPDDADEGEIQVVIDAHDPNSLSVGEQRQFNREADDKIANEAKQDFRNMPLWATLTPQEVEEYIINNVNDLASAKVVLCKMAIMLTHLRNIAVRRFD